MCTSCASHFYQESTSSVPNLIRLRSGLIATQWNNCVTLATLGYRGGLETAGHGVLVARGERALGGEAIESGIAGEGLREQGLECELWATLRRETGEKKGPWE